MRTPEKFANDMLTILKEHKEEKKPRYMLVLSSGGQFCGEFEYDTPGDLHNGWYYWSNCRDSQGFANYVVKCYQEIDPTMLPL